MHTVQEPPFPALCHTGPFFNSHIAPHTKGEQGPRLNCWPAPPQAQTLSLHRSCRSRFYLPSATQSWAWAFHSCNGLSMNADTDKWGAPNLWEDVLQVHQRSPMHACVGGGDQVYSVSPPTPISNVSWA